MATATQQRAQAVAYMKGRKKKNSYTQGSKRGYFFGYPDNAPGNTTQKGYSDCSAAAQKAIMAATGIDIGSNTSAQINNRNKKGVVVHETDGFYPDESKLLPGDCLYFKGNPAHPLDVGHVEMYTGKNECTGHGSGTGPTVKNLKTYCKGRATKKRRYFMAIRWIKDDGSEKAPAATAAPACLKKGSKGAEVKTLQQNLLTLGYKDCSKVDGDFGAATEKAVKAFQRDHGLEVDGICGTNTRKAIEAALQNKASAAPRKVRIVGGDCNARTAPNTKGKSLGTAKKGRVFAYQGQTADNGWHLIEFNGQNAWVSGRYSKLED